MASKLNQKQMLGAGLLVLVVFVGMMGTLKERKLDHKVAGPCSSTTYDKVLHLNFELLARTYKTPLSQIDPSKTSFVYDEQNRLLRHSNVSSDSAYVSEWSYDETGRLWKCASAHYGCRWGGWSTDLFVPVSAFESVFLHFEQRYTDRPQDQVPYLSSRQGKFDQECNDTCSFPYPRRKCDGSSRGNALFKYDEHGNPLEVYYMHSNTLEIFNYGCWL